MSIFQTKILLATDGSEDAELAAREAIEISRRGESELHVVHVGNLRDFYVGPNVVVTRGTHTHSYTDIEEDAKEILDRAVEKINDAGGEVAEAHLEMGDPAKDTIELAEQIGAGLIVVGSRGLGALRRALTGSVSENIVRHAHCPVLVVRGEGSGS